MDRRASFVTETVCSHPSKVELVADAISAGYVVHLHVMLVPVELSVRRVVGLARLDALGADCLSERCEPKRPAPGAPRGFPFTNRRI